MSKYDFEIDLSLNTSTGIILNKIRDHSVVLEFGCATGRMTRYMQEKMNCRVYIVEYDREAYDTALQYAQDGVCGDIMDYSWVQRFGDIRFDAILFADVLEHLPDPVAVLKQAARLLKDSGTILASVPNITHNDILLKCCCERFDYTPTGILDDSHVRFWGLENLRELAEDCGLTLRFVEGTRCPTGYTEQFPEQLPRVGLLENILNERRCGEVYQFVFALDKDPAPGRVPVLPESRIQSHVYLDTGRDFNPEEVIGIVSELTENGYHARWETENYEDVKRVRFDPVELQGCILRSICLRQGGAEIPLICPEGHDLGDGLLLAGEDPLVYTDTLPGTGPITLEADILLPGQAYLKQLEEAIPCLLEEMERRHQKQAALYDEKCRAFQALQAEQELLRSEITRLGCRETELQEHILRLDEAIEEKEAYVSTLQSNITALNDELARCRVDIGAYITLANSKDLYAMELERRLNRYENNVVMKLVKRAAGILRKVVRKVKNRIKRGGSR